MSFPVILQCNQNGGIRLVDGCCYGGLYLLAPGPFFEGKIPADR